MLHLHCYTNWPNKTSATTENNFFTIIVVASQQEGPGFRSTLGSPDPPCFPAKKIFNIYEWVNILFVLGHYTNFLSCKFWLPIKIGHNNNCKTTIKQYCNTYPAGQTSIFLLIHPLACSEEDEVITLLVSPPVCGHLLRSTQMIIKTFFSMKLDHDITHFSTMVPCVILGFHIFDFFSFRGKIFKVDYFEGGMFI